MGGEEVCQESNTFSLDSSGNGVSVSFCVYDRQGVRTGGWILAEKEGLRTWVARLADLATAPVVILALAAVPVAWLSFSGTFVPRVDDGRILSKDKGQISRGCSSTDCLDRWNGMRTVMSAESMGRICEGSGRGSLSGQYMTQGDKESREMLRTRPPTLNARPDGVSGGY